jgi:two-component system sensor histidine kinase MtrB
LVNTDIARLRQLVDDLLEISRLDARAAETLMESVDLQGFLVRLVQAHGWSDAVRVAAGAHSTGTTQAAGAPGAPAAAGAIARTDKRRVERIIVNLVENSLQHGAAPVTVEVRRVTGPDAGEPATSHPVDLIQVAVTDSGPGIPLDHLPHIFDRFYKADPSRASSRGSGLGLAIARENARLLGGELAVTNAPGGGACFVLSLPAGD